MKVLCIDKNADRLAAIKPGIFVVEGGIYTVLSECPYSLNKYGRIDHIPVYELVEFGKGYGFATSRFIPVSDIDETELVQHRELEKVREGLLDYEEMRN